jgi:hypothetical protein
VDECVCGEGGGAGSVCECVCGVGGQCVLRVCAVKKDLFREAPFFVFLLSIMLTEGQLRKVCTRGYRHAAFACSPFFFLVREGHVQSFLSPTATFCIDTHTYIHIHYTWTAAHVDSKRQGRAMTTPLFFPVSYALYVCVRRWRSAHVFFVFLKNLPIPSLYFYLVVLFAVSRHVMCPRSIDAREGVGWRFFLCLYQCLCVLVYEYDFSARGVGQKVQSKEKKSVRKRYTELKGR